MRGTVPSCDAAELEDLEARVTRALVSDEAAQPEVLGYGEVSCILALRSRAGALACKRLPPFPSQRAFDAYRACFEAQLASLAGVGIPVLASEVRLVRSELGFVGYCLQPRLDADALLPAVLRNADAPAGRAALATVLGHVADYVSPTRGLDAQLSNWALLDGELVYLDVTTPLLRDARGRERLDVGVFLASLPWALRGLVRRFLLRDVLAGYYAPERVALDLLGNTIKEGLADHLADWLPLAAERLGLTLTEAEVRRHYRSDARLWSLLQRLRRIDRAWQRSVRRRPYLFLLPGTVERRV